MRILVGKTFGIGNAVLAVPMIKAVASLGHSIDVLVGDTRDDFGAFEVMRALKDTYEQEAIQNVWVNSAPANVFYDIAIMAIPYDGRWKNGVHFHAKDVWDERKRPGNVPELGFHMWEKHEVEYQMENARVLGCDIETPSCSFLPQPIPDADDTVYLGVGYKRDPGGFGASKHFGNERYGELIRAVRKIRPETKFLSTGGPSDLIQSGYQIIRHLGEGHDKLYRFHTLSLEASFQMIGGCRAYIGNDTGFMHVAASLGMPTCGLFAYPDLVTKNPPFCEKSKSIVFSTEFPSIEYIAEQFVEFVWGTR